MADGDGRYDIIRHYHHPPDRHDRPDRVIADLSDKSQVKSLAEKINPDIIINCAALADVDRCETEPETSYRINVTAVENLILSFPRSRMVQISTDYVFGDDPERGSTPPTRDHATHPVNVYGQHKLEAERIVMKASPDNLVVRVNTLLDYTSRRNFLYFVYDSLKNGHEIAAVTDQVSNPITALSAAELTYRLLAQKASGIYHLGGEEFLSRYDLARRIARFFDLDDTLIEAVISDSLPRPAMRPRYAGLDCAATEKILNISMPELRHDLARIKDEMMKALS